MFFKGGKIFSAYYVKSLRLLCGADFDTSWFCGDFVALTSILRAFVATVCRLLRDFVVKWLRKFETLCLCIFLVTASIAPDFMDELWRPSSLKISLSPLALWCLPARSIRLGLVDNHISGVLRLRRVLTCGKWTKPATSRGFIFNVLPGDNLNNRLCDKNHIYLSVIHSSQVKASTRRLRISCNVEGELGLGYSH